MTTQAQEIETTTKKSKAPAKKGAPKAKAKATTATKFSVWCKENGIKDTVKARRALRASGRNAPYSPDDAEVRKIAKESQK